MFYLLVGIVYYRVFFTDDTSTIYLTVRTIAMKRRVQRPVANFALVACLMESLVIRIQET